MAKKVCEKRRLRLLLRGLSFVGFPTPLAKEGRDNFSRSAALSRQNVRFAKSHPMAETARECNEQFSGRRPRGFRKAPLPPRAPVSLRREKVLGTLADSVRYLKVGRWKAVENTRRRRGLRRKPGDLLDCDEVVCFESGGNDEYQFHSLHLISHVIDCMIG